MIEDIFTPHVLNDIKLEIKQKDGVEVFFVGKVDSSSGRIASVKPCAWGNDDSVAIIFDEAYKGDYVIHNHPSGALKPSANDIAISSHFGNLGIGFIIINNSADEHFTVVKSCDITEISLLDPEDISKMLLPGGEISESLKEYEHRQGQIEMVEEVCECFNSNNVGVIEAGTGTGKSLAYLIPAALWSIKNKEKIVISTNTINLQEQLVKKDIPFIKKALNLNFKEVLVKGRGNYACLRKILKLSSQEELFDDDVSSYAEQILSWAKNAKHGTKEELTLTGSDFLWDKIASERDLCIKNSCPDFTSCFFFKARKEMVSANILVVNHHILCSDISIRKNKKDYTSSALLPPYTKVIIDEAHNIEDAVSSFFGTQISRLGLKRNLSKIFKRGKRRNSGVLSHLGYKVTNLSIKYPSLEGLSKIEDVIHECYPKIIGAAEEIDIFFDKVFDFTSKVLSSTKENKLRLTPKTH
jgi:ATP-dependent DNA helicase DinG